ncbi:MAG: PH domain-containing protein [Methanobacterium sp.]|nr:PH domain-containing protein [Methanobacterium sp.]
MNRNNQQKHPGERILFKTRPMFIPALEPALFKLVILLLILFFFTTLIGYAAVLQGKIIYLTTFPFVEWFTYGLILIVALLFLSILWSFLSWKSTCYILTDKRVIIKSGIISKKNIYMHYNKIQDIIVSQGIVQRITSSGDIQIYGGHDRTTLFLKNTQKPKEIENRINQKIAGNNEEYNKNFIEGQKFNRRYGI